MKPPGSFTPLLGVMRRIGPHDLSATLAEMRARAPHFIASATSPGLARANEVMFLCLQTIA
jgi:hypothetical protein